MPSETRLSTWIECRKSLPPNGEVVMTKTDDSHGVGNERRLKRKGSLWVFPDDSMYVYYTPTHWMTLKEQSDAE